MKYRRFGQTNELVSVLGFGCMRLPEREIGGKFYIDEDKAFPLLRKAYENGVNYFDSAPYYCHSNSEYAVGKALAGVRGNVKITSKLPLDIVNDASDLRRLLEGSLKKLDSPYIDFYHLWGMDETWLGHVVKNGLFREMQRAKEEGLVRHVSFSFHDGAEVMMRIIDAGEGIFESVLCQYNLLRRDNEPAMEYAVKKGLGVAAMGPVAGGRLAAPAELYKKLSGRESTATYELALRFVLGNRNVAIALSGMENEDMLLKNLEVVDRAGPMNAEEWARAGAALEDIRKLSELYCTGCGYCQPCPVKIDIPKIFGMYTYYNVYGLKDVARKDFAGYLKHPGEGAAPSACTGCGLCEQKCPQNLKIRDELVRVANILEGRE